MKLTDIAIFATCTILLQAWTIAHFIKAPASGDTVYVGHQAYTIEHFEGHQYLVHASGAICQLPDPPPKPTVIVNPDHPFIGRDYNGNARRMPNE